VGVVDQVAHEFVADVFVVGVVFPRDREFLAAESPGDPEQQVLPPSSWMPSTIFFQSARS